jgi:hypothetical protein
MKSHAGGTLTYASKSVSNELICIKNNNDVIEPFSHDGMLESIVTVFLSFFPTFSPRQIWAL